MKFLSSLPRPDARQRWWLWLPLLGVGAWLSFFGDKISPGSEAEQSLPTRRPAPPALLPVAAKISPVRTAVPSASQPADSLLALVRRESVITVPSGLSETSPPAARDLFAVRSWTPPPPPPPPPPPAPAPVAPPIPFVFVGKKLEAGAWEIYLSHGEQTLVVHKGQVVEGMYRIEKIDPPHMQLTYLPLNQVQTVSIGERP